MWFNRRFQAVDKIVNSLFLLKNFLSCLFNDGFVLKQMFALLRGRQVNEETSSAMNVRLKFSGFQGAFRDFISKYFLLFLYDESESNPPFCMCEEEKGNEREGLKNLFFA